MTALDHDGSKPAGEAASGTPLTITGVETILLDEFPNLVHVRLYAGDLVGLGETYFGARTVAEWIHETAAPYLLGANALEIEKIWHGLNPFLGFKSTGAESRGRSAVDIALWDLFGKYVGQPLYQLLGGAVRDAVPVYNTCAGARYIRAIPGRAGLSESNWGLDQSDGPYEDLRAFLTDAGELAESLLEAGISGMKIWPLDPFAEVPVGHRIPVADLKKGLEPFERIRSAVGDRIEIMVEMHSLWGLPAARQIAHALEEYEPAWIEDPIKMDDLGALRRFAASTRLPIAASETLGTRWAYRDLLDTEAVDIVIFDPTWTGGVTESKKIASMAEAYQLPIAPHDCSGPVAFATSVHLTANAPNAIYQESVRAFYNGWYRDLVTEVPKVEAGMVSPLQGPGVGTELRPDLLERFSGDVRRSEV